MKFEIAIFFYDISIQIEVNGTFATVACFVLHNKKLLAVKFLTNSFTCSYFLLSQGNMSLSLRQYMVFGFVNVCRNAP